MNDFNNPVIWAVIGTIFGGSGLAIITKLLNRGKDKFDIAAQIRDELREDIKRYQGEVAGYKAETTALRAEVDSWRNKYFELDRQHYETIEKMQGEMDTMKKVLKDNGLNYN